MLYSKVVAIMNIVSYESIIDELKTINIPGISITNIKGCGGHHSHSGECELYENTKLEIYAPIDKAQEIATFLSQLLKERTENGGIVAIEPVTQLLNYKH